GPDQAGAGRFEGAVHRERAADEAHRRRARPPAIQRGLARRDDLALAAQAEVVVRGEDDDLAPTLHPHPGRLGAIEVVEALVDPVPDELLQVGLEPVLESVAHAPTSRITLPAWPSLIT